ncbi:ABC transporter substrate-binding protein [Cereibacter azotoformans]|uniref:ABC transporter substrate-binding protein n=1 Tax=Cereibacter azotoformans TaxID=43057 RepID=UPI001EEC7E10|nr:ABC transporter substrate-binding protein [Cereibacter azotoformans]ULB09397.1 ABC transporter substrate-binding protein [Cereibacter azotoformans]
MKAMVPAMAATLALASGPLAGQELTFPPGEDDRFHWNSFETLREQDFSGQRLTILGPWLGPDRTLFNSVIAYFEAATGAAVTYNGSDNFEQQIVIDASAGSPPDIAIFPQPGLARDLASKGQLAPLDPSLGEWLRENYAAGDSWVNLGTFPGRDGQEALYGFFYKIDVKSLVWYVPENFADFGYEVPGTMEELLALSERMVEDGVTPWCIGLASGGATGWPATDWVEDMMLRINPPEVYDQWTLNEIPFDDPQVVAAIEEFGRFARDGRFVAGGPNAVAATDFRDSPKGLFAAPPQCFMHKQASFIPSFFPEGTVIGEDADFFYLPAYESRDLGQPVLGAGTVFGITRDTPVARAFIDFLKTPIAHEVWMAQTGFLTPHTGVNTDVYGDPTLRKMGDILLEATTFRFDGSDLMPGAVGAGAFWTGMIDYMGGQPAETVAAGIQRTWDTFK